MIIVIEENNLSQELKIELKSSLNDKIVFCNPKDIAKYSFQTALFVDIYFEALSYCLINDLNFKFLYNNRILTHENIEYINSLQDDLLKSKKYNDLKKLNLMKVFLEVNGKKAFMHSLPAHLQLEHTTYCNATCIMCDHYISHNRNAKHLQLATVSRLESILPYISLIVMHGNGEPFLNPDIIEIMELYKSYGVKISTNTNLSHLNDDICSELSTICESLQISCDGCDKETYEGIRQGLSFDVFCKNLERVSCISGMKKTSLEVVLMQQNIRQAPTIVKFAHSYGIKTVKFHDLGINNIIGNEKYSLRSCPDIANKYISLAREEGKKLGVHIKGFEYPAVNSRTNETELLTNFPNYNNSNEMHKKFKWYTNLIAFKKMSVEDLQCYETNYSGICEYPFAKSYIDLNGNMSVCCPSSRKVVGHIASSESFAALWNSETMMNIRNGFYSGKMPSFCQNCFMVAEHSLSWLGNRKA